MLSRYERLGDQVTKMASARFRHIVPISFCAGGRTKTWAVLLVRLLAERAVLRTGVLFYSWSNE